MEPQLIELGVLKKLHKKRLELNNKNLFTDTFFNIWIFIKKFWIGTTIVILITSIMVYFYIIKQRKNQFENNIIEEDDDEYEPHKPYDSRDGYEAEYYKMLPRVTHPPTESYV